MKYKIEKSLFLKIESTLILENTEHTDRTIRFSYVAGQSKQVRTEYVKDGSPSSMELKSNEISVFIDKLEDFDRRAGELESLYNSALKFMPEETEGITTEVIKGKYTNT